MSGFSIKVAPGVWLCCEHGDMSGDAYVKVNIAEADQGAFETLGDYKRIKFPAVELVRFVATWVHDERMSTAASDIDKMSVTELLGLDDRNKHLNKK